MDDPAGDELAQAALVAARAWAQRAAARRGDPGAAAAEDAARGMAVAFHARLSRAYASGRANRGWGNAPSVLERIAQGEAEHVTRLESLRRAARRREPSAVVTVLDALIGDVAKPLRDLVVESAALPDALQQSRRGPGLRTSVLARRSCMLAAAAVLLHRRLTSADHAASTKAAEGCTRLTRRALRLNAARLRLGESPTPITLDLLGQVRHLTYVPRPGAPYGTAQLGGGAPPLRVPWKSMARNGVAVGSVVLAHGTSKHDKTVGFCVEVEQEGPASHAGEVWEDWLTTLARDAYDLAPGTLRMEWEFPAARAHGSLNDLLARVLTAKERTP